MLDQIELLEPADDGFETYEAGSRIINVFSPGHGLVSGTTYRFRGPPTKPGLDFYICKPSISMVLQGLILQSLQDMRLQLDYIKTIQPQQQ